MSRKSSKGDRKPAWKNRKLLTKLSWKVGTWEVEAWAGDFSGIKRHYMSIQGWGPTQSLSRVEFWWETWSTIKTMPVLSTAKLRLGKMWAHCWMGGAGHNTEKASTFFTAVFTDTICLQQSQVPKTHWKFSTRKAYSLWKKIRLHSLFCGCNHWWKMQCSCIARGLFIRILSQQQQDT